MNNAYDRLPERDTPVRALMRSATEHSDRLLLRTSDTEWTHGAFAARAGRIATGLQELGVRPGDFVATMLDNSVDCAATWFATAVAGAVHVPLNTALRGEFLRHPLRATGARFLIAEGDYLSRVPGASDGGPEVLISRGPVPVGGPRPSAYLAELERDRELPPVDADPSSLMGVWYTGGTTGPSKGSMLSGNQVCEAAKSALRLTKRTADDHLYTPLPYFHFNATATTLVASVLIGGSATVADRFSVSRFWPEILESRATMVTLLGSMVHLIAHMEDTEEMRLAQGQLHTVWAIPFAPELIDIWKNRFGVKTPGGAAYGQTETGFIASTVLGEDVPVGASGRETDLYELAILDDEDRALPVGTVGEIAARPRKPDVMFKGYWGQPVETIACFRNLWHHTGDLGRIDEDGWLYFVDRKADYLRRRGENISSQELESAFLLHPEIHEVTAYAVPSELAEDDVKITVVLEHGSSLTEERLCHWAFENVPRFAVPRYIEFANDLPRSPTGRVLKRELRDQHKVEQCWDRERAGLDLPTR
ncbi:AMP-binding protein [Nocardioides sp. LS1]|uniref:AMP-binding protein n=1 Tax=Nocardioides sp. LS1 TaxID=1027620 RepID=UPI000F61E3FE|nr:AMP-binding protein [Nocardioides sp. LS1]GCD90139.1 ATP-dependent acyl-CoA ligase [Nocardioides sp. LS1]